MMCRCAGRMYRCARKIYRYPTNKTSEEVDIILVEDRLVCKMTIGSYKGVELNTNQTQKADWSNQLSHI